MPNNFFRDRRVRRVVAVIVLMSTEACYNFMPLATSTSPIPGQRVRVALTTQGTSELARYLGPNVVMAEGELTSASADGALLIAVDFVHMSNGTSQPWNGEGLVTFPRAYIAETRARTFAKRKSVVAGTALATLLFGTAVLALRSGGAKGGSGNPPPPPP